MIPLTISHLKHDDAHLGDMHEHTQGQLFIMQKGLLAFETTQARWVMPLYHAGWVPPYVAHNAQTFDTTSAISLYIDEFLCKDLPGEPKVFKPSSLLVHVIHKLESKMVSPWDQSQVHLLNVLLDELSVIQSDTLFIPLPKSDSLLTMTRQYIENPSLKYNLEEWAQSVHMTKRTLTRKFRQEIGMSMNQWTQQVRLVKGCELLAEGHSVTTTAYQLGYENVTTFINLFKKFLHKTPKQYLDATHLS